VSQWVSGAVGQWVGRGEGEKIKKILCFFVFPGIIYMEDNNINKRKRREK